MFMQAGFAFLEAGLTRMKNAAHIAGKNVLIFGICSLVYWAGRLRPRLRRRQQRRRHRTASRPRSTRCSRSGRRRTRSSRRSRARARYLFEVVFAGVSLAIVWGAMAERAKLWVYFAFGVAFTLIYSVVSHWIWAPDGWLFALGMQDFAGSTVVHYQGALAALAGRAPARAADRQVRPRRPREPDPGPQHALRRPRDAHPLVRLVRLQPGLDARRS